MYHFVFVYTNLVKMVEEECKYSLFCISFKCRFQHPRDLNWRVVLGEYFLSKIVYLWGCGPSRDNGPHVCGAQDSGLHHEGR